MTRSLRNFAGAAPDMLSTSRLFFIVAAVHIIIVLIYRDVIGFYIGANASRGVS